MGFVEPTPVQEKLIPLIGAGDADVVGLAQTGTGKTAAFGLPILQKLSSGERQEPAEFGYPRLLVLCPTRELCIQIAMELERYAAYLPHVEITAIYGGAGINDQIKAVRKGTDIIAATPGRLLDLIRRGSVDLSMIKYLVLDEADIMLDMGFKEELDGILSTVPTERQTILLSATMPEEVARIASHYMHDPLEVVVGKKNAGTDSVEHSFVRVRKKDKYPALKRIVDYHPDVYGIVFCRTKADTQEIADLLIQDGYDAEALHGDLSQSQREWVMKKFRDRNLRLLIATDVAARGLDLENLSHIIHYSLPDDPTVYTHRSGRTGRAGKTGCSISIITDKDSHHMKRIERTLKRDITETSIPLGSDICEKPLLNMIDKIKSTPVNDEQIEPFMTSIQEKLSDVDKETLIKQFISNEFNRFLKYYGDNNDLTRVTASGIQGNGSRNRAPSDKRRGRGSGKGSSGRFRTGDGSIGFASIKINVGKSSNLRPEQVIGLINKSTRNRHINVGRIEIEQHHAVIDVDEEYLRDVTEALDSHPFRGKKIKAEPWGEKDSRNTVAKKRNKKGKKSRKNRKKQAYS
jgi:ATP-dependent RNA helicase DeaD